MLTFTLRKGFLSYQAKWFFSEPERTDARRLVQYQQCPATGNFSGFKRDPFYTKVIDLTKDESVIWGNFRKNTKYEIKRAGRDGMVFQLETDMDRFISSYNKFAESLNLSPLSRGKIAPLAGNLLITKAVRQEQAMGLHAYLCDPVLRRARQLYAPSFFRINDTSESNNFYGMANRFLHYQDMVFLKARGFLLFDLGGYAYQTKDPKLQGINEFKNGFGGELIQESNYFSYPLYLAKHLAHFLEAQGYLTKLFSPFHQKYR